MKTALITGGCGGIGSAICAALADAGYKVVAAYYEAERGQAEAWQAAMNKRAGRGNGNGHAAIDIVGGDVGCYDSAKAMVAAAERVAGPIDVLVNCAGITRDTMFKKMRPEQWSSVLSTNLDSAYNVTHQVIHGMLERGFGRIINIASVNGQKGQFGQTNYSAAKAGLHGFTMALAQETARKGVTVNTISPGYISTPMTMKMPAQALRDVVGSVPMGRMGEPEEIAHAVLWLADDKSAYVTGANIPINGGLFMAA